MPRVSTYDSPQVRQAGLPDAQQSIAGISPSAFGAENAVYAQQAGQIVKTIDETNRIKQDQYDADRLMQADAAARKAQGEFETQQLSKQGANAAGVKAEGEKWWADKSNELMAGLDNDRQRKAFSARLTNMQIDSVNRLDRHETTQRTKSLEDSAEAMIDSSIDHAAANYNDPNAVSKSRQDVLAALKTAGGINGWTPEVMDDKTSRALGKLHQSVIGGMFDNDPGAANAYYQAHKDEIPGALHAGIEKTFHDRFTDDAAKAHADELIASGVSYTDALADVRKRYNGKDEDRYVTKIKERFGEMEHEKRQASESIRDGVYKQLATGGDIAHVPDETVQKLIDVDPESGLRLKQQIADAKDLNARGGAFAKETNPGAKSEVDQMIVNGSFTDPSQLKAYRGQLEESDYKAAEKAIENRKTLKDTNAEQIYNEFVPRKKRGEPETPEEMARRAQFIKDAADYVKDTSRPQDVKAFAANWFLKGKVDSGHWYMPDKTMALGDAAAAGQADKFKPIKPLEDNALTHDYLNRPTSQYREGQTATGKDGTKIVFKNGAWRPL